MNKALILAAVLLISLTSCGNRNNRKQQDATTQAETSVQTTDASTVYVYYFHGKQRCKTCMAVNEVTEKTVKELYGDNPKVRFVEVETNEEANIPIVEQYEVTWNALIVAKGADFNEITQYAFANAVNNPDALKERIKAEVDKRL